MENTFRCDCGRTCTLETGGMQTEIYGYNVAGITTKCMCCGKISGF